MAVTACRDHHASYSYRTDAAKYEEILCSMWNCVAGYRSRSILLANSRWLWAHLRLRWKHRRWILITLNYPFWSEKMSLPYITGRFKWKRLEGLPVGFGRWKRFVQLHMHFRRKFVLMMMWDIYTATAGTRERTRVPACVMAPPGESLTEWRAGLWSAVRRYT